MKIQKFSQRRKISWKKKLLLPCLIIFGTFIANYFFQVNIMYLILIDAVIGYLWLQDEKYS